MFVADDDNASDASDDSMSPAQPPPRPPLHSKSLGISHPPLSTHLNCIAVVVDAVVVVVVSVYV